jgi:hypothetical protein
MVLEFVKRSAIELEPFEVSLSHKIQIGALRCHSFSIRRVERQGKCIGLISGGAQTLVHGRSKVNSGSNLDHLVPYSTNLDHSRLAL